MISPEILQEKFNKELSKVWTGLYGKIDTFDKSSLTASVKPLLKVPTENDFQELPLLVSLPVNVFYSGGLMIVPDYQRGDIVYLAPSPYPVQNSIRGMVEKTQEDLDSLESPRFGLDACSVAFGIPTHPFQLPSTVQKSGITICDATGATYLNIKPSGIEFKSGQASSEKSVLGESLKNILSDILDAITSLTVPCSGPGATSGVPINTAVFLSLKARLSTILSQNIKNN
ncbi:hypothetical protein LEP1GSC126_3347 [Leptospira kirschneri str. 200801774]|uniref:Gp138 family membrane-puncturing spike protein n=1 Tax=Leptospira kirschneri TaxID=29507 RepID=UPI0002BE710D|nr:Gp138 family membrane-puncturing spike protein [Leptospira kirschneri]EMO80228.1 hypothetical protein LEP1GSC126_3347 [Leptospira kirschneri str. 200801774]